MNSSNSGDWQALAEIYLSSSNAAPQLDEVNGKGSVLNPTYCLCSRVFIKNYYDIYASTLEKDEDVSDTEEAPPTATAATINDVEECPLKPDNDTHVHFSVVSAAELLIDPEGGPKRPAAAATQDDADNDANSCYYSASASHTDNYCSTDEHEQHHVAVVVGRKQQKQQRKQMVGTNLSQATAMTTGCVSAMTTAAIGTATSGNQAKRAVTERLHSSDSGADISENHLLDKMRWHGTLIEDEEEINTSVTPATAQLPPAQVVHHHHSSSETIVNKRSASSCGGAMEGIVESPSSPLPQMSHERNNSLPNVLCPEELATEWETYWSRHGEQLIWASWIEKYSDYIDPAYKEGKGSQEAAATAENIDDSNGSKEAMENLDNSRESEEAALDCCSTANTLNEKNIFTFDEEEIEGGGGLGNGVSSTNNMPPTRTEIVVSNCSPGGRNEGQQKVPGEEGAWTGYRNRLSVDERLLSPRCDSVNSSIPYTIGGVTDSMTNVTRMTISSCEFCSSKVTSESSQNSMASSTASSNEVEGGDGRAEVEEEELARESPPTYSSSQFYDTIDNHTCGHGKLDPGAQYKINSSVGVAPGTFNAMSVGGRIESVNVENENAMDVDQYWQVLWEKHFQEQYARHYKEFTEEQQLRMEDRMNTMSGSLKSEAIFDNMMCGGAGDGGCATKQQSRRSRSVKRLRKTANDCLPKLVANLRIKNEQKEEEERRKRGSGDGQSSHEVVDGAGDAEGEKNQEKEGKSDEKNKIDESNLMASYGLPQAFGSTKRDTRKNRDGGGDDDDDDDEKDRPPRRATTLKRSHESDSEEVNHRDRIKDAFQLMGFAYENTMPVDEQERGNASGEVVYRKKHIRLHNRALKMKIQTRPKLHIRFDEEGMAIGPEVVDSSTDGTGEVCEGATAAADPVLLHSSSDDDSQGGKGGGGSGGGAGGHHQRTGAMASSQLGNWMAAQQQSGVKNNQEKSEEDEEQQGEEVDATIKKKKRKRKGKITALLPPEIANDKTLMKYWYKRFSLFQLFDQGIRMDRESWFSVTPEKVAAHAAERCRCDVIVDGFCGVGGNAIQFALTCERVIAIDIDPKKIEMAKHNANIYGVADRIEFIVGDFFQLAERLKADVVFLSPPWGGPQYMKVDTYDLEKHLQPVAASVMMEKARQISGNVAIFLPRNSNTQQLTVLAGVGGSVEIEQSFLDRKLIALTAYYGELINE